MRHKAKLPTPVAVQRKVLPADAARCVEWLTAFVHAYCPYVDHRQYALDAIRALNTPRVWPKGPPRPETPRTRGVHCCLCHRFQIPTPQWEHVYGRLWYCPDCNPDKRQNAAGERIGGQEETHE